MATAATTVATGWCSARTRHSWSARSGETVANAILELASQLDLMGLALIFKLGAMPYDMVERSMTAFGEDVVPRIRPLLDRMPPPTSRPPHRR
jgi:hypothetical protein